MIAGSAAYQIKYYVLAVSEWFSHGLDPELTFLTGLAGGPRRRKADDEVPCDLAVTMRA